MNATALVPVTEAQFPGALAPLFKAKRFKVVHGGRGAGRSWGFARALLILNLTDPERTLCAREFQKSIQDSVHRLLADQISLLEMNYLYEVQQARIIGRGQCQGAEFSFDGIRSSPEKIKSNEGVKRCWVEEANKTTKQSWNVLIPTIRREDSEIWATFNSELEEDETYQRFVVNPPGKEKRVSELVDEHGVLTGGTCTETFGPNGAFVIWNSYRDNPWFPRVLRAEMEEMKERDFDEYLHVWEGHCKQTLEGAVFADELRELVLQNRVREVPYDRTLGVNVFFDLGRSNNTAMWFEQRAAWEHRFINFYQNSMKDIDHYMQVMQAQGYTYDTIWLPHDGFAMKLGQRASIATQMREKGFFVREVPGMSIENGINAARMLFPTSYFDRDKCADGLHHLRRYSYAVDEKTKRFSRVPLHDEHSDAADAFRYAGIGSKLKMRGVRGRLGRLGEGLLDVVGLLPPEGAKRGSLGPRSVGGTGWLGR